MTIVRYDTKTDTIFDYHGNTFTLPPSVGEAVKMCFARPTADNCESDAPPTTAHDCDGADCCKPADEAEKYFASKVGKCEEPTRPGLSPITLLEWKALAKKNLSEANEATFLLIEARQELKYLREKNTHFREMLALKSESLVKANAKIERLERLLGQFVSESCTPGLFPDSDCPRLREGFRNVGSWSGKKEGR